MYNTDRRMFLLKNTPLSIYIDKTLSTQLFVSYCGDEWLVCGKINRKSAVDFLEYQISLRKMNVTNDMIDPDEWLKTLLNVEGRIYRGELCTLVNSFFE